MKFIVYHKDKEEIFETLEEATERRVEIIEEIFEDYLRLIGTISIGKQE